MVGLACHLHHHQESLTAFLETMPLPQGADASPRTQSPETILAEARRLDTLAPLLDRLLSQWLRTAPDV